MPSGLKRFHESGQSHFVKFSCYHRRPMFAQPATRRIFEAALERVRLRFSLCFYGYVVMPEHVHLLMSEPAIHPLKPNDGLNGPPAEVATFRPKRWASAARIGDKTNLDEFIGEWSRITLKAHKTFGVMLDRDDSEMLNMAEEQKRWALIHKYQPTVITRFPMQRMMIGDPLYNAQVEAYIAQQLQQYRLG